jgi:hypothetical protein
VRHKLINRQSYATQRRKRRDISWPVFLIPLLLIVTLLIFSAGYIPLLGGTDEASDDVGAGPEPTVHAEVREWTPSIALQYYKGNETSTEFLAENVGWLTMQYGMEDLRQQVLDRSYRPPVLQYMLTFQIRGPGPYTSENDECENEYTPVPDNPMWTDDFCELVHSHESWFLHNGDGERIYNKEKNWDGTDLYEYYMNPASDGYRKFWVSQMKRQQAAGWQGFSLDNVPLSLDYLRTRGDNQDGEVKEFDSSQEFRAAVVGLLDTIRENFPGYPIWGNMIRGGYDDDEWDDYLDHLDGFHEEHFANGWTNSDPPNAKEWDGMLKRVEKALRRGKGVALFSQGEQDDSQAFNFSLASFLLIATEDGRASFRYTHTADYKELWWYPEYETNLGLPKGKRYKQGKLWQRDFQCARVMVDPEARSGTIQLRPCQR